MRITKHNALEVVVPARADFSIGKKFLRERIEWVRKHLQSLDKSNNKLFYFGTELKVNHSILASLKKHTMQIKGNEFIVNSPTGSKLAVHDLFLEVLRFKGKIYLTDKCSVMAKLYGFEPKRISIRGQSTRWGSCSRRGTISLNYKLLQLPEEAVDYIIMHELCHLRHPNHSANFWTEVEKYVPDYKRIDKIVGKFKT